MGMAQSSNILDTVNRAYDFLDNQTNLNWVKSKIKKVKMNDNIRSREPTSTTIYSSCPER